MKKNLFSIGAVALLTSTLLALPAVAASGNAEWVQPVNEGVKSLTSSLVSIAGGVIGIAIVGFAIWGAIKQKLEMPAFVTLFICGLLVGIGPAAITWWIDLVKQS